MALFDHCAETYDERCVTPLGCFVDAIEKQMMMEVSEPKSGEKALDIGCGTGIYSLLLSSRGIDVTGVDISTAMLKKAREKTEKSQHSIAFVEGEIRHLPFADHVPDEFVTKEQAYILENQRSKNGQEEGAGFIVAQWIKKGACNLS